MVRPAAFIITIGKRRRHYCDVCVRIEAEAAIGFGETFTVTPIAD